VSGWGAISAALAFTMSPMIIFCVFLIRKDIPVV
jgi:hypothetical protein